MDDASVVCWTCIEGVREMDVGVKCVDVNMQ